MRGLYRIADKTIEILTLHPDTHALCAAYRTQGEIDFSVRTAQADVDFERARSAREAEYENLAARTFSDGYLETLAVCRAVAEKMPRYDTLLMHGSCICADGAAYLFTAKSGVGKSTHTRLWREYLGDRAVMVNDDKPFLRITPEGVMACGSPWDGKHHLSSNITVPLRGLCILERAQTNVIRPVTAREAYPVLLQQAYRPMQAAALEKTAALLDRICADTALWRLGCNMDIEAAKIACAAMLG